MVINKAILRNNYLKKFKNIRYAKIRNKAALHTLKNFEERLIVFRLIHESLKCNPINIKTWFLLLLSIFPKKLILLIINYLIFLQKYIPFNIKV